MEGKGGVSWGCSSLRFSTEGVIRRDRDERFRTNPARNIFRSADRGFTQWRENAIGAGRRKLPKSQQSKAKRALQEIWMAETKKDALAAFDAFIETWGVKYDKAVECLIKDRDALLAFYDFPAEHWKHLRTTNPIESSFATVRHRTVRSKGCLSNKTALAMIFKLAEAAEKSWRRLDGHNQLPKILLGVKFTDGIEVIRSQAQAAAA